MFALQIVVLIVLLLGLYAIYRALMNSPVRGMRVLARISGAAFALLTLILALVIRPMVFETAIVTSDSMVPTLEVGDRVLANKTAYGHREPRRGDVVTFRFPSRDVGGEEVLVKRVVGIAGDVVEVRNSAVYVNRHKIEEPYVHERMNYVMSPTPVTTGKILVLGDNRNESDDSHEWGLLDRGRLIGKVTTRIWPAGRVGTIK